MPYFGPDAVAAAVDAAKIEASQWEILEMDHPRTIMVTDRKRHLCQMAFGEADPEKPETESFDNRIAAQQFIEQRAMAAGLEAALTHPSVPRRHIVNPDLADAMAYGFAGRVARTMQEPKA